jgi:hypothetical protein
MGWGKRVSMLSNETLELSGDVDLLQLIERRRILSLEGRVRFIHRPKKEVEYLVFN